MSRFPWSIVFPIGLASAMGLSVCAGAEPPGATNSPPTSYQSECQAKLGKLDERMTALGTRVLEGRDSVGPTIDEAFQSLVVQSAKARHQQAVLRREVAEIALKEFQDVIVKRDEESSAVAIELAKADLAAATRAVGPAQERYAKTKNSSDSSVAHLSAVWRDEAAAVSAELNAKKFQFALDQAEAKRKVFLEFERVARSKHLLSELEKVRADELASRASRGIEESKLKKVQKRAASPPALSDEQKAIQSALERAIPLEERLSGLVEQVPVAGPTTQEQRTAIDGLFGELQTIVARAEQDQAAADLAKLKANLFRGSTE
jgi:hypothetical protein